jgi:hypothetical protein
VSRHVLRLHPRSPVCSNDLGLNYPTRRFRRRVSRSLHGRSAIGPDRVHKPKKKTYRSGIREKTDSYNWASLTG